MNIELKNLDANCSDCIHLERLLSERQKHVDFHFKMQKSHFDTTRIKLLQKGEMHLRKAKESSGDKSEAYKQKAKANFNEARKMVFVFDEGSTSLFYGNCLKHKKPVSFIPQTLQLETQHCFEPRA